MFNECGELIQLDTKDVMGEEVVATVRTVNELGKTQHPQFRNMRIIERTFGIDAPLKKNNHLILKVSHQQTLNPKS